MTWGQAMFCPDTPVMYTCHMIFTFIFSQSFPFFIFLKSEAFLTVDGVNVKTGSVSLCLPMCLELFMLTEVFFKDKQDVEFRKEK